MPATKRADIDAFLALRRIAVIGVSRKQNHFSRVVFRAMAERGYDVVPVNLAGGEIESRPCFESIGRVAPAVEGALIMAPAREARQLTSECVEAGVDFVWLYRGECDGSQLRLIRNECPFMWLGHAGWIHDVHRTLRGWFGGLPA